MSDAAGSGDVGGDVDMHEAGVASPSPLAPGSIAIDALLRRVDGGSVREHVEALKTWPWAYKARLELDLAGNWVPAAAKAVVVVALLQGREAVFLEGLFTRYNTAFTIHDMWAAYEAINRTRIAKRAKKEMDRCTVRGEYAMTSETDWAKAVASREVGPHRLPSTLVATPQFPHAHATITMGGQKTATRSIVTYSEAVIPADQFGGKTIGYLAGLCLLINNVTGPGLAQMPAVFQQGGWVLTMGLLAVCCLASGVASLMLLEAIKAMPGNSKFDQRIEFMTMANHVFQGGRRWAFWVTLLLFVFITLATLISSVIESAQTMDAAFADMFGKTCALQFHNTAAGGAVVVPANGTVHAHASNASTAFGFVCVGRDTLDEAGASPFGDSAYVLSVGYIFVALMAVPLGIFNLDDNIWVQKLAFQALMVIFVGWVVESFIEGWHPDAPPTSVPAVGRDMSSLFGVVLFNFAFVTTLPSWVNEKQIGVSITTSVWFATVYGTVMFALLGVVAAGAWDFSTDGDLLSVLLTNNKSVLLKVMVYLFPIAALVTSIPIFSIVIRYNLLENNVCGVFWSNIIAVVLPWVVSIPLYTGSLLDHVVTWSGLFLTVPMNFVLPAYFYLVMVHGDDAAGSSSGGDGPCERSALLDDAESCATEAYGLHADPASGRLLECRWGSPERAREHHHSDGAGERLPKLTISPDPDADIIARANGGDVDVDEAHAARMSPTGKQQAGKLGRYGAVSSSSGERQAGADGHSPIESTLDGLSSQDAPNFRPDDIVEAWIPGLRWVPCRIQDRLNAHQYRVVDGVTQMFPPGSVVPVVNLRRAGAESPSVATSAVTSMAASPHRMSGLSLDEGASASAAGAESTASASPATPMEELRMRLDYYEQRIDDLRSKIADIVTQPPPLSNELAAKKKRFQQERFRLQRQVNKVLRKMDELDGFNRRVFSGAPARSVSLAASPRRPDDARLTDELFTALPSTWSRRATKWTAYGMIGCTCALNTVAFGYAFAGSPTD